jgi:FMN-dependent oxidoreductase (nitrilotriacetate monooxygenase family)
MCEKESRQMHLAVLLHPLGTHPATWRAARSPATAATNFAHYAELVKTAEQAKFDFVFFADALALRNLDPAKIRRSPHFINNLEPLTLLGALAPITSYIGLAGTVSTTYVEPYNVARQFASLDHISGGRTAWNVVTSTSVTAPLNFGQPAQGAHADRYRRAREFVEVVTGLWDSWDDDAFVADTENAVYFDPDKCHILDHRGELFSVRGPLNIARPPQGHPVIIQAGGSEAGKILAAETAEVIFTNEKSVQKAREFYSDVKSRLPAFGRSADELKILPAAHLMVGRTTQEAKEKLAAYNDLLHPDVAREVVEDAMGAIDLSDLPMDRPFPIERLPKSINGGTTYFAALVDMITNERPSFGELCRRFASGRVGDVLAGDAVEIADHLEHWFRSGAADGFMFVPLHPEKDLADFAELVVPELQRRGLFRSEYESDTLRGHLGLKRPAVGQRAEAAPSRSVAE